jgi:hypothetical protein
VPEEESQEWDDLAARLYSKSYALVEQLDFRTCDEAQIEFEHMPPSLRKQESSERCRLLRVMADEYSGDPYPAERWVSSSVLNELSACFSCGLAVLLGCRGMRYPETLDVVRRHVIVCMEELSWRGEMKHLVSDSTADERPVWPSVTAWSCLAEADGASGNEIARAIAYARKHQSATNAA